MSKILRLQTRSQVKKPVNKNDLEAELLYRTSKLASKIDSLQAQVDNLKRLLKPILKQHLSPSEYRALSILDEDD